MLTLDQLVVGQSGTVVSINGDIPASALLGALGLLPGKRVRVERCAPLGDPISLAFEGQIISVRRRDAEGIEIG
jgi:ferrous iron transport protein A